MATTSIDLRQRIVAAYDRGEGTRKKVAERFAVSEGLVKKLLSQRKRIGTIEPLHYRSGRKPELTIKHKQQLREEVARKPDSTLKQLKKTLGLKFSQTTIHRALKKMGITYKKRRFARANKTVRTSVKPDAHGKPNKAN